MYEEVKMKSPDGETHIFFKFRRLLGLSERDMQARLKEGERMLKGAGIPITNDNLRALGLGSRTVNCLRTGSRASEDCKATDYERERERARNNARNDVIAKKTF